MTDLSFTNGYKKEDKLVVRNWSVKFLMAIFHSILMKKNFLSIGILTFDFKLQILLGLVLIKIVKLSLNFLLVDLRSVPYDVVWCWSICTTLHHPLTLAIEEIQVIICSCLRLADIQLIAIISYLHFLGLTWRRVIHLHQLFDIGNDVTAIDSIFFVI